MRWDEWRGSMDGRASMLIKRLLEWRGYRIDLHKFLRADDPGCFHTHPANAVRIILWGGYFEEVLDREDIPGTILDVREWKPLRAGKVPPALCHRVSALRNGRCSYSLWFRAPKSAKVQIVGQC